jgi:exo-beta-1,3-glucanase (GH17 family)
MDENRVRMLFQGRRWACYAPTDFCPLPDPALRRAASEGGVRSDLQSARHLCDGLITYGIDSGQDLIPAAARAVDPPYRGVIVGLWSLTPNEVGDAIDLVRRHNAPAGAGQHAPPCPVSAICAGNEGLFFGRYDLDTLRRALDELRAGLPEDVLLTTSEPIPHDGEYAVPESLPLDFHLPTIHPFYTPARALGPEACADYVVEKAVRLRRRLRLDLGIKECGWPSGGARDATPEAQVVFWRRFAARAAAEDLPWALFELFDTGDWKIVTQGGEPCEVHWGWHRNDPGLTAKPVAALLPRIV